MRLSPLFALRWFTCLLERCIEAFKVQLQGSYLSAVSPPLSRTIRDAYGSDDEERSGGRSKTPSGGNKKTDLVSVVCATSPYRAESAYCYTPGITAAP